MAEGELSDGNRRGELAKKHLGGGGKRKMSGKTGFGQRKLELKEKAKG